MISLDSRFRGNDKPGVKCKEVLETLLEEYKYAMDKLWAPWRIKYITAKRQAKCIFCQSVKFKRRHYVIFNDEHSVAMLNIFPYNNGHIMVSPSRHVGRIELLKDFEILSLFKALNKAKKLLDKALKPHGYNIGINIGKNAGAGITEHLHMHIVPRWQGDTNFMPVLYKTKVISQSLAELYKQLIDAQSNTDKKIRR